MRSAAGHDVPLAARAQVFILDSLASYNARDAKDAESIVERVTPRLQHANCAVVLSAVKARPQQLRLFRPLCMDRAHNRKQHTYFTCS